MRKSFAVMVALVAFSLAAESAWSMTMTEQQVRNVCGSKLQSGGTKTATAIGCEKKCGTKLCTYGCITEKGKTTCSGTAI